MWWAAHASASPWMFTNCFLVLHSSLHLLFPQSTISSCSIRNLGRDSKGVVRLSLTPFLTAFSSSHPKLTSRAVPHHICQLLNSQSGKDTFFSTHWHFKLSHCRNQRSGYKGCKEDATVESIGRWREFSVILGYFVTQQWLADNGCCCPDSCKLPEWPCEHCGSARGFSILALVQLGDNQTAKMPGPSSGEWETSPRKLRLQLLASTISQAWGKPSWISHLQAASWATTGKTHRGWLSQPMIVANTI